MIRITTLLWIALLVVAGGTVMHVSYQVRRIEQHQAQTQHDIRQEEDAIRILGAEWDTLNDPKRIDELAKRYVPLEHTPIQRVASLESLPLKAVGDQGPGLAAPGAAKPAADKAKDRPASQPAAVPRAEILVRATKPETRIARPQIAAARPAPAANLQDGVGLILARLERRE
jgi:cell division protein FtsL